MSRGITFTLLAGLTLTACLSTGGCRGHRTDYTWYDAQGNVIEEKWKTDEAGNYVLDSNGWKIPDPHPYDRYHNLWLRDSSGNLVPPAPPPGTRSRSTFLFWGGSGYRSYSSGGSSSIRSGGFGSSGGASSGS